MKLDDTVLPDQFHEFYREVIDQKQKVGTFGEGLRDAQSGDETPVQPARAEDAHAVATHLLGILERQALDSSRRGGEYGTTIYQEAQYVMAALADEIFLNIEWPGRDAWEHHLLEHKLFGTHVAGERLFVKMDKLLKDRDSAFTGLAAIYLLALSFGFQGKFRGIDDEGKLDYYRSGLFSFIYRKNPDLMSDSKRLFPEAYAYQLEGGEGKKLPGIHRWIGLIALIVIAYVVVSHILWTNLSDDMAKMVETFIANNSYL